MSDVDDRPLIDPSLESNASLPSETSPSNHSGDERPLIDSLVSDRLLDGDRLASRSRRLLAAVIDSILLVAALLPLLALPGALDWLDQADRLDDLLLSLLVYVAMLVLHGYLLVSRGQSIGKWLLNIQIVDAQSQALLPVWRVLLLRTFWLLPIDLLATWFLGEDGSFRLVSRIGLVDSLFIFGKDRRCLHDVLANSLVMNYDPTRTHNSPGQPPDNESSSNVVH